MSKGEFSDVVFLKVDVDENEEASQEYNISAMPTFIFVKNNGKVWFT
jgi:thioredoxin 1